MEMLSSLDVYIVNPTNLCKWNFIEHMPASQSVVSVGK